MLTQKRIGLASITSLSMGAREGSKVSCVNIQNPFIHNLFSANILCNFLEMIMLIILGTITETRMEIGRDKFPSKGPIRVKKASL